MIRRPPRSTQSRSSAASDVYKRQVDDQPPAGALQHVGLRFVVAARAAQQRPNARREFARAERLGEVVVGAELQALHQILLTVLGGEHDDGHVGGGADAACLLYTSPSPRD